MKLQALKILVVTMGLLIFVGLGFLAYGLATKISVTAGGGASQPEQPCYIMLPEGAEVSETKLDDNRLLVRLTLSDGSTKLLVFDLENGRQTRTLNFKKAR